MRHHIYLLGLALVVSLCLPHSAFAVRAHTQNCYECHKSGNNPRTLANVCTPCHETSGLPPGSFTGSQASDAMGSHPNKPEATLQTSHFWGGTIINQATAAGAASPPPAFYTSRYAISTGRLTCTICHDPHSQVDTKLLRASTVDDVICQKCHTGFYIDNPNALKTHPIGNSTTSTYALLATDTTKFKPVLDVPNNAAQGITLINGYVTCSTCHAAHFADSNSLTLDGLANVTSLGAGDGHLLKADGPTRDDKSSLCQTCHTYKNHGNPDLFQEDVGCLVCHSGHAYNGGVSNYYVLRNAMTTATFGLKTNALYTPLTDLFLMNKKDGSGLCERCHGLSSAITNHSIAIGGTDDRYLQNCKDCHKHNNAGTTFSWKWDANILVCGDCHGFPPYLNVKGDSVDPTPPVGTEGGFAVMDGATDDSHSYATSGYSKNETVTPHKSHAAGGDDLGAYTEATDYKFGEGGAACDVCHNLATHKQIDNTTSFRNIVWGPIAKGNVVPYAANLIPIYTTSGNGSCTVVYCHSNGGKRTGDDWAKSFKFPATAPVWGTGDADIINIGATECSTFCHGNSATSMNVSNRDNSLSHGDHLNKGYTCNVCHQLTAAAGSITTLRGDARVAPLGKHVNGKPDVAFDTVSDYDPIAGTQLLTTGHSCHEVGATGLMITTLRVGIARCARMTDVAVGGVVRH